MQVAATAVGGGLPVPPMEFCQLKATETIRPADDPRTRNKRQQILEAAARQFSACGFHGANMRDVAADAGVLAGSIYYHFESKDALFVAVHGAAIGPRTAKAQVTRIFPAGFTKVSSLGVEQQRVKVIMKFEPEDWQRLRDENDLGVEYRVRVRIYTAASSGALVIPRSALFRGAKNDWRVFSVRGGRAHLQAVKIGLANDEWAEITAGLDENDQVILAPETNLGEGQRVRVLATDLPEAR